MPLFREEVAAHKTSRLQGTIDLSLPFSWKLVAALLFSIIVACGILLDYTDYTNTEMATGIIVPQEGILTLGALKAGTVAEVYVHEGQSVASGQVLASISTGSLTTAGDDTQGAKLAAIRTRESELTRQGELAHTASILDQRKYAATIEGLEREILSLTEQLEVQQKLVTLAKLKIERVSAVAARGFISTSDMDAREEGLLNRQQQLASIQQALTNKKSALSEAKQAGALSQISAASAESSLIENGHRVEQERLDVQGSRGYALISPANGVVTAFNIYKGDAVSADASLLSIVPQATNLVAEIFISSKSAGFVKIGQTVRAEIDAFPLERFGALEGKVGSMSISPIKRKDANGRDAEYYSAVVRFEERSIRSYMRKGRILPGMNLSAMIAVEKRPILHWLFPYLNASAE